MAQRSFDGWADLTDVAIEAFVDAQLSRGLAAKTVKTQLDILYRVLYDLRQPGQLTQIPPRPGLTLPDPLPQHLPPAQVVRLEAYVAQQEQVAQDEQWLDIALYYLWAHGGLRISEALDLQVQDLDLSARRVRVRYGKGQRDRVVFLTTKATHAIRHYLQTVPHAAGDLVLSWPGRPLGYQGAWGRIRHLGQPVGIERLSPQRLRHTYATLLLNNGVSITRLQKLMGHDNINTTLIYARLADETVEQQYQAAMRRISNTPVNSM